VARRKELPPARRELDLHRLTIPKAMALLEAELIYCRSGKVSPLLVITGRGSHSSEGQSVLRPQVETWLRGPEGQALGVLEVREAPRSKGGALWLRLASAKAEDADSDREPSDDDEDCQE
jgi:DNA-nicking Smr family endonuclease